ncbi:MAG: PEP-CTERM sorting domain-containing protein [Gammaproteobacteria bacterium]|nr:PEP-CTERM sorting domain-containing protein [Gammaproteobacteria bacterium]
MSKDIFKAGMFFLALGIFNSSQAAVIDFETVPGGSPADQLAISNQYLSTHGVSFSLLGGGTPYLERVGISDSGQGFWNAQRRTYDVESPGFEGGLGDYFLRFNTGTLSTAPGPTLLIYYLNPVSAASAQIWDIDAAPNNTNGYESWMVTAYDNSGTAIDTLYSPIGINENSLSSLNGKPWEWSFNRAGKDIYSIQIAFNGTANIVGLAFDNFSPAGKATTPPPPTTTVPEPATLWLLCLGLFSLYPGLRRN